MNLHEEFIGQRRGTLVVVEYSHSAKGATYWKCMCDCGRETVVARSNLSNPRLRSCGCLKDLTGKQSKLWKGCGDISASWFSRLEAQARRRGITVSVSLQCLWDLFCQQGKRCALSGLEIRFPKQYKGRGNECTASLDRIDSQGGYEIGNVQWLHKDVNFMKHKLSQERFLELCGAVHRYSVMS